MLYYTVLICAVLHCPRFDASARPYLGDRFPATYPKRSGSWTTADAFPLLRFQNPTFLSFVPGYPEILWVSEREGRLYRFSNSAFTAQKTLVLDLSPHTQGWHDSGLLSFAFHPEFGQKVNRNYVFVFYQYRESPFPGPSPPPSDILSFNRLSRFSVDPETLVADPASEVILVNQADRSLLHNGGSMFFGIDGFLYLSLGDEGGIAAPENAQRLDHNLFGGIIRIDVDRDERRSHPIARHVNDTNSFTGNYFIPNSNPFVSNKTGLLEEFFCFGLRSPHRISQDRLTSDIWIGDVGAESGSEESLFLGRPGENYGWPIRDVSLSVSDEIEKRARMNSPLTSAIYAYRRDNDDRCLIGGYVYRGREHPELFGKYIFGDNVSGRLWAMSCGGGRVGNVELLCRLDPEWRSYHGLSSFGVDEAGELYLCILGFNEAGDGHVRKLLRNEREYSGPSLPHTLSETGAFSNLKDLDPGEGLKEYFVNLPFWSDGALKRRWIAAPTLDGVPQIGFSDRSNWTFPSGTVFVKHFELPRDDRVNSTLAGRIETRFLVTSSNGAYGLTYRWRSDQSDADLVLENATENLSILSKEPLEWKAVQRREALLVDVGEPGNLSRKRELLLKFGVLSGDFDLRLSVEPGNANSWDGLVSRRRLSDNDLSVIFGLTRDFNGKSIFCFALKANERISEMVGQQYSTDPVRWIRLRRTGDRWTAYVSTDGFRWEQSGETRLEFPETTITGAFKQGSNPPLIQPASTPERIQAVTWSYFAPQECLTCHNINAGYVLGVNTRQLNLRCPELAPTGNQLSGWKESGFFGNENEIFQKHKLPQYEQLAVADDNEAELELRARSYLDVNCSHCHRGQTSGGFDARFSVPLPLTGLINGPVKDSLGIDHARVIAPGDPWRSILMRRLSSNDETRMPPLGRSVVDKTGVRIIRAWIESMSQRATAAPPKISLLDAATRSVRLSHDDPFAKLYYQTLNGAQTSGWLQYTEPVALNRSTGIRAWARRDGMNDSVYASLPFAMRLSSTLSVDARAANGLIGYYFDSQEVGKGLPVLVRLDPQINFERPLAHRTTNYSVRWEGWIRPSKSGKARFFIDSDDGARLWIGDKLLIDAWHDRLESESFATAELDSLNYYPIRLEYYQHDGSAVARFSWALEGRQKEIVPSTALFATRPHLANRHSAGLVIVLSLAVCAIYLVRIEKNRTYNGKQQSSFWRTGLWY